MLVDKLYRGLVRRRVELTYRRTDEVADPFYIAAATDTHIEETHVLRPAQPFKADLVLRYVMHHNVVGNAHHLAASKVIAHLKRHQLGNMSVHDGAVVAPLRRESKPFAVDQRDAHHIEEIVPDKTPLHLDEAVAIHPAVRFVETYHVARGGCNGRYVGIALEM